MKTTTRLLTLTFVFVVLSTNLFAQKNSTVNWFGYVRTYYQHNLIKDAGDEGQFKQFLATMGFVADINEYSSVYLFSFFNYPSLSDIDGGLSNRNVAGLLDAQLWFKPVKNLKFVIGQYVTPFATENLKSPSKTDFVNWCYVVANSPVYRDIGIYANYKTGFFSGYAGISNGSGMNQIDNNKYKNGIIRWEITPNKGMKLASAAFFGKDNQPTDIAENLLFCSANLSYKFDNFQINTEVSYQDYQNGDTKALYAYTLYDIHVGEKLLHYITPAFRYDFLDTPGSDNRQDRFTFGLAFSFDEDKWLSMFRLNYELTTSQTDIEPPDAIIAEFQMRFD